MTEYEPFNLGIDKKSQRISQLKEMIIKLYFVIVSIAGSG